MRVRVAAVDVAADVDAMGEAAADELRDEREEREGREGERALMTEGAGHGTSVLSPRGAGQPTSVVVQS